MIEDIDGAIAFLDSRCTSDEFVWLSEIFEDLASMTRSRELISALYRAASRFPKECEVYDIVPRIKIAEGYLDYLEEEEKEDEEPLDK